MVFCSGGSCRNDRISAVQLLFYVVRRNDIMSLLKRKKLTGFLAFCIGLGILFAVLVPAIGWVMFSAICLISIGIFLIKY